MHTKPPPANAAPIWPQRSRGRNGTDLPNASKKTNERPPARCNTARRKQSRDFESARAILVRKQTKREGNVKTLITGYTCKQKKKKTRGCKQDLGEGRGKGDDKATKERTGPGDRGEGSKKKSKPTNGKKSSTSSIANGTATPATPAKHLRPSLNDREWGQENNALAGWGGAGRVGRSWSRGREGMTGFGLLRLAPVQERGARDTPYSSLFLLFIFVSTKQ